MRWGLGFCCRQLGKVNWGSLVEWHQSTSLDSCQEFFFFFFEGVYFGAGSIRPYQSQLRNMALLLCGFM